MQDFKDEMRAYKEENRPLNRDMNRRWGELANKMGTMVEDAEIIRWTIGAGIFRTASIAALILKLVH